MIPKIIHYIYVGGRPFSFVHFLAVYTAWKVNQPRRIYLHCTEEPAGRWWDAARPLLTVNRVAPVHEVFGRPVRYPAHMADVIRLDVLQRFGGIYLDLDVVCLRPFDPLLKHEFVMGIEPGTGLCNAVILARRDAEFLGQWRERYRSFDGSLWNHHSVVVPWQMARATPERIHVADKYAFFYPTHNDPVHRYLWGERPKPTELATRLLKNAVRLLGGGLAGDDDAVRRAHYRTFHGLRGNEWHYRRARRSYCLHLWEGLWGESYLRQLGPDYLLDSSSNFARLLRDVLTVGELEAMRAANPAGDSRASARLTDQVADSPDPARPVSSESAATFSMR